MRYATTRTLDDRLFMVSVAKIVFSSGEPIFSSSILGIIITV